MLYQTFQAHEDLMGPIRAFASAARETLDRAHTKLPPLGRPWRALSAAFAVLGNTRLTFERPAYDIAPMRIGNREIEIVEEAALTTPFGTLLHFKKDVVDPQPRVLIVAPLSGHFATLLRNTVQTMLQDHDVYITDWHNARDVPREAGRFGLAEYVGTVIQFLDHIGPGAHVLSVCQPCAHALASVAIMAEDDHPAMPRSMTLMAGPVDTRINPSTINKLATDHPISWFEQNVISTVPWRYAGAGRRVYPGFVQLTAFLSMNLEKHIEKHRALYRDLKQGEHEKARATREFYDEYFAVLDLPAEFYLETVKAVFQDYDLPQGRLKVHERTVNPKAIRKTALLTVEGERDDICSLGQTMAAHDLCSSIKPYRKRHHLQSGVGHYGVFSGSRWQNQIYPIVRSVIQANDG
jgi:polyhydroxyalkanoate depolymerase